MEKLIGSIVRHLVTATGAVLVVEPEVLDQVAGSTTALVIGVLTYALGQGLSWLEKTKRAK